MHVLVTSKNEEDPIKMKVLEWPQHFLHFNSLKAFPDAQGHLTPKSMVGSGQILLMRGFRVVLATCKNEEDPIKLKALEWPQHHTTILQMLNNSYLSSQI